MNVFQGKIENGKNKFHIVHSMDNLCIGNITKGKRQFNENILGALHLVANFIW